MYYCTVSKNKGASGMYSQSVSEQNLPLRLVKARSEVVHEAVYNERDEDGLSQ